MRQYLHLLSFEHSGELITLLDEILKRNQSHLEKEIEMLKNSRPDFKQNLVEYFIIAAANDKYCFPAISTEGYPDWFRNFLINSYVEAHNQLAEKYKSD